VTTPIAAATEELAFVKVTRDTKRGTAVATARVPGPGKLVLTGKGLRRISRMVVQAGEVKLVIRAYGTARRRLADTGRATVRAEPRFTAAADARVRAKMLKLVKRRLSRGTMPGPKRGDTGALSAVASGRSSRSVIA